MANLAPFDRLRNLADEVSRGAKAVHRAHVEDEDVRRLRRTDEDLRNVRCIGGDADYVNSFVSGQQCGETLAIPGKSAFATEPHLCGHDERNVALNSASSASELSGTFAICAWNISTNAVNPNLPTPQVIRKPHSHDLAS
jgi:hypothetical protein